MSSDGLTRREALARGAGAVVATGLAATGAYWLSHRSGVARPSAAPRLPNYFASIDLPDASPRLSIATGDEARIDAMVRAAVGGLDAQLGMRRFITANDTVVIKPNAGFDRPPSLGATTHPEVLRTVIRLCREAGAQRVIVTDYPIESPEACFARSGLGAVATAEGADLVWPSPGMFELLTVRARATRDRGEALERWPIFTRPLRQATKLIGIAPVKDHNLAGGSMQLKNWYGLLGGRRNQLHQAIHEVISDVALLFSPTLVIADGTRVMLRSGPTGGRLSDVQPGGVLNRPAVVASVDPVACDAWCYENLLGRNPGALRYLELAHAKIAAETAAGVRRHGERDWRRYATDGRIVTTDV